MPKIPDPQPNYERGDLELRLGSPVECLITVSGKYALGVSRVHLLATQGRGHLDVSRSVPLRRYTPVTASGEMWLETPEDLARLAAILDQPAAKLSTQFATDGKTPLHLPVLVVAFGGAPIQGLTWVDNQIVETNTGIEIWVGYDPTFETRFVLSALAWDRTAKQPRNLEVLQVRGTILRPTSPTLGSEYWTLVPDEPAPETPPVPEGPPV